MKNLNPTKKSLTIHQILVWTILFNLCLFSGLYLFFRTEISQNLSIKGKTTPPIQPNLNQTQLVAKNIPISSSAGELISQTLPEMGHAVSAGAGTASPTILPTLLETTTVSKSATPVTMTKIVKMPQTVSNNMNMTQSDKMTPKFFSTPASVKGNNTPSVNHIEATKNPADTILIEHDLPAKNHTVVPSLAKHHQQQNELEARTEQLSEAINAVKRLNQQAIDKSDVQ